jgi:hypothetical protein
MYRNCTLSEQDNLYLLETKKDQRNTNNERVVQPDVNLYNKKIESSILNYLVFRIKICIYKEGMVFSILS